MSGGVRWGLATVGLFVVVAVATLSAWEGADRNPVTGDEPHYLVMADSLVSDRSLEVTDAYTREFSSNEIYASGLAAPGSTPDRVNAHAIDGERGAYSVHSYGLPALVALPFAIGGVLLAKLTLIALTGVAVWVVWRMSERHDGTPPERAAAVGVVMVAMAFVTSSTQLYPDLPAAVLALVAVAMIQRLEADRDRPPPSTVRLAAVVTLLGLMPWFHIKTAATAVVLTLVIATLDWRRVRSASRTAVVLAPLAIGGVTLLAYNAWAFGRATGPYSDGALRIGGMPATVLLGLYVDQFQGMFVQNPALLVALVALVPFVRRFPVTGLAIVLTHLSFVVPNAMHENWYGGFSFAGRFGVAGALVIAPVAVFGIAEALRRRASAVPIVLLVAAGGYQLVQFVRYAVLGRSLYNDLAVLPEVYPSQIPVARGALPMLYRSEWAFRLAPNITAALAIIVLLAVGASVANGRHARSTTTPKQVRTIGFGVAFALVVVGGVLAGEQRTVIRTVGRDLGIANGRVIGDAVSSDGTGGIVTFGPYVRVGSGLHSFGVRYRADADPSIDDEVAGDWVIRAVGADEAIANGALIGADRELAAGIAVDVPAELAGRAFELQTSVAPGVELDVFDVTVSRAP